MSPIFAALALAAGSPAAAPPPFAIEDWKRVPTSEDLARRYPAKAQSKNIDGVAIITCKAQADGTMTGCAVTREYPAGENFGLATLALAPLFQLKTPHRDGQPIEGREVRLPIRWVLPGSRVAAMPKIDTLAACYGQLANRAEQNAQDVAAWRGSLYWYAQMINVAANRYSSPSELEASMSKARMAAADGTLKPPPGYDVDACIKKLPKP
ncbi:MAG: energy transducer TonB [Phenylobacterium sp.]|uniref:energy transducer TonB n=1 Tax=Phenylobacterium sp. TaxID=1871053 RepID=UPI00271FD167|nr:energy transducer TonB [Phenylobacterium sp.]MDO8914319.1 energy transducer TonB [Phenylobacterium sp.]MDP3102139.1 energy transducer TonB [Phenylobacterium sp.]